MTIDSIAYVYEQDQIRLLALEAENQHLRRVVDQLAAERDALQRDLAAVIGLQSGAVPVEIEFERTDRRAA